MKLQTFLSTCILGIALLAGCSKPENPNAAEISFESSPDNAKVTINGVKLGTTPLKNKIPFGSFVVMFEKEDYVSQFKKLSVSPPSPQKIEAELPPVTASVLFTSNPSGAIITKDGSQLGETPHILHENKAGKYSASISKPGYVTEELTWEILDARPIEVKTDLKTNIGTLVIESTPPDANVSIGGKYAGKTPFTSNMEQGELEVKVYLDGYTSFESTVSVIKAETKTVTANLAILPGSLKISSTPAGASVFLNGEPSRQTPTEIKDLKAGTYTVKLEKEGYDSEEHEVKVPPGKQTEITYTLSTNMGGIDLLVNPPGVTIYLDGKKVGVTEPESAEVKYMSKVFEIRGLKSGEHSIVARHSRAVPNEKKITVTVEKGQIARPKQETLWVADTYLKLKSGREMKGRIKQDNEKEILFEPTPGVTIRYSKDEIKTQKPISE